MAARNEHGNTSTGAGADPQSPLRIVAGMAFTMASYAIGMKAARGVGFRANLGLGRAAVNLTRKGGLLSGLRQIMTKHGATKTAKRLHKATNYMQTLAAKVRGSSTGNLNRIQQHLTSTRMFSKGVFKPSSPKPGARSGTRVIDYRVSTLMGETKVLKNSKLTKWFKAGQKYDAKYLSDSAFKGGTGLRAFAGLSKNLSPSQLRNASLGGSDFGKVIQARATRWGSDFLAAAPVMYAMDKARGFDEKRKWYNPASIGAWATEFTPMMMAFEALGPLASKGAQSIGRVAFKSIGKGGIENITAATLNFGTKVDRGVGTISGAFAKAMNAAASSREPASIRRPIKTITDLAKNVKIFGKELGGQATKIIKGQTAFKHAATPMQRILRQVNTYRRAAGEMGDGAAFSSIRRDRMKDLQRDPGGFSGFINKMTSLADENVAQITHTKDRLRGPGGGALYRGKGQLSYKGSDYKFSSIHPSAIRENFLKFMSNKGPGFLGIRQMAHNARKEGAALIFEGQSVNLGIQHNPNMVQNWTTNAMEGYDGKEYDLKHYLTNSKLAHQKQQTLANLAGGKYQLKDREMGVYMGERLYLLQQSGGPDNAGMTINRMGLDTNRGVFLKYGAIPIEDAGNMTNVLRKAHGKTIVGNQVGGYSSDTVDPDALGFLELGPKQRKPFPNAVLDMVNPTRMKNIGNERVLFSDSGMLNPEKFKVRLKKADDEEVRGFIKLLGGKSEKYEAAVHNSLFKQGKKVENTVRNFDTGFKTPDGATIKLGDLLLNPNADTTTHAIRAKTQLMKGLDLHRAGIDSGSKLPGRLRGVIDKMSHVTDDNIGQLFSTTAKVKGYGKMNSFDAYNNLVLRKALQGSESGHERFLNHLMDKGAVQRGSKQMRTINGLQILNKMDTIHPYARDEMPNKVVKKVAMDLVDTFSEHKEALTDFGARVDPIFSLNTQNPLLRPGRQVNSSHMFIVRDKAEDMITGATVKITDPFRTLLNTRVRESGTLFGAEDVGFEYTHYDAPLTMTNVLLQNTADVVNDTANFIGIGFDNNSIKGMGDLMANNFFKRVVPAMGIYAAWQGADAFTDESQLFEGTALGEGLNVFAASQAARARLGAQNILDKTGIGGIARHMEDLLPGSMSSPLSGAVRGIGSPIAGLGVGFKMGGPTGGMIGGAIGAGISLLTAGGPLGTLGLWDISKDRNELIEEYSGRKEVAVKRGRYWMFGASNIEGNQTMYYKPNWYAELRSQSQYTPTLYGSKTEKLLAPLDAQHYAEKHYWSRPYLETGSPFENIPLFGKMVPFGNKPMHEDDHRFLGLNSPMYGNDFSGMGLQGQYQMDIMRQSGEAPMNTVQQSFSDSVGPGMKVMSKTSPDALVQSAMLTAEEITGLRGWGASLIREGATGQKSPWENTAVMRSAQEMTSFGRSYWDSEMGDMLGMNEIIRRFIKYDPEWMMKADSGLPNTMPTWMPKEYQVGDPFTKVQKGEMRLPGQGYAAGHDVDFTMPFEASMFGMSFEEQVDSLTGKRMPYTDAERYERVGGSIKDLIAQKISGANAPVDRDKNFFNPYMNLSGTADIVKQIGGKKHVINVKIVGNDTFGDLRGQEERDKRELNATLAIAKQAGGTIMYVNAESGETKSVGVSADLHTFKRDLSRLSTAQNAAANQLQQGMSPMMNLGNAFSRVDRMKILADVAPNSKEFFNVKRQVQVMSNAGLLDQSEMEKANVALDQRDKVARQYDFEQNRFYNIGTAVTEREQMRQKQIKQNYNWLERKVGSTWEYATNELFSPIHTKLMADTTALERYKRTQVYGKEVKLWHNPIQDFAVPYKDQLLNNDDFLQGAMTGALPGVLFGPAVGIIGGATGMAAAGINFGGGNNIPEYRQKQRDIVQEMDELKYAKYSELYRSTGDVSALREMQKTMMYSTTDKNATMAQKLSSLPRNEKPYFRAFAEAGTKEEREQIMALVPDYMKGMLTNEWKQSGNDALYAGSEGVPQPSNREQIGADPWLMSQNVNDLTVKRFESEALDAHDVGMGFYKQQRRMDIQEQQQQRTGSELGPDIRSVIASITGSNAISVLNNNSDRTIISMEIE